MDPERVDAQSTFKEKNKIVGPEMIRWFEIGLVIFVFELFKFNFIASPEGHKQNKVLFSCFLFSFFSSSIFNFMFRFCVHFYV